MGPNSDLGILVVVADGLHRRRTAQTICRSLMGPGVAKDVVVATESDLQEHGGNPLLVLFSALPQGRELCRAAG